MIEDITLISEEIVICGICKGKGTITKSEIINYHNNISDEWLEKCETCKGSGRLVRTVKITTNPFIPAKIINRKKK